MARVSNIDPWHRSRGTVEDETEVMSVAAGILRDLKTLETQRPALMDHAVAGSLTERHLAPDIAVAITRSYRTYWANYESSFIHLHRVAHKHLPPTADVLRARSTIKAVQHRGIHIETRRNCRKVVYQHRYRALVTHFLEELADCVLRHGEVEEARHQDKYKIGASFFACNAIIDDISCASAARTKSDR
ncbi:hypothetical protein KC345_g4773 [Hortaea werneckii]|nr:hypothetical protein KC345_g4773 [Hortaea werneckii]